jgi:hypothetical protein
MIKVIECKFSIFSAVSYGVVSNSIGTTEAQLKLNIMNLMNRDRVNSLIEQVFT